MLGLFLFSAVSAFADVNAAKILDREARRAQYRDWMYARLFDPILGQHVSVVSRMSEMSRSIPASDKPAVLSIRCEDRVLYGQLYIGEYIPKNVELRYRIGNEEWVSLGWSRTWFRRGLESADKIYPLFVDFNSQSAAHNENESLWLEFSYNNSEGQERRRSFDLRGPGYSFGTGAG